MEPRLVIWHLVAVASPALLLAGDDFRTALWPAALAMAALPLVTLLVAVTGRSTEHPLTGARRALWRWAGLALGAATLVAVAVALWFTVDLAAAVAGIGAWTVAMTQIRSLAAPRAEDSSANP